jgi:ABC-type polysaccharide/polyol phosphate export permease
LLLVGLACLIVGVGAGIPQVLALGLLMTFFMVPVVYLREKIPELIRGRLGKRGGHPK